MPTQIPAPAPAFCTFSSWLRSAFFSCFGLDLVVGEISAELFRGRSVCVVCALIKKHKADQLHRLWFMQQIGNSAERNLCCRPHRKTERPGGNGRETHAVAVLGIGLFHGVAVAALQNLGFVYPATRGRQWGSRI